MESIISKIRDILEENLTDSKDFFTYISSDVFTLSEPNIYEVTTVLVNDAELGSAEWSFNASTNKVSIESGVAINEGDTIEIQYSYYPNYTDNEITAFVKSALYHLSINNYSTFFVDASSRVQPEPTEKQKNLIAMIASVLIRPENRTYRLPDITIQAPTDSLSREDKIRKIITIFKKDGTGIFSLLDSYGNY